MLNPLVHLLKGTFIQQSKSSRTWLIFYPVLCFVVMKNRLFGTPVNSTIWRWENWECFSQHNRSTCSRRVILFPLHAIFLDSMFITTSLPSIDNKDLVLKSPSKEPARYHWVLLSLLKIFYSGVTGRFLNSPFITGPSVSFRFGKSQSTYRRRERERLQTGWTPLANTAASLLLLVRRTPMPSRKGWPRQPEPEQGR